MNKVEIVADSKNSFGQRITSMVVTFPRFLLAEMNTHRVLSRNSASSRAIRFSQMVKAVQDNPFIPIAWQKDHPGMQGTEYFTEPADIVYLTKNHLEARDFAVFRAQAANTFGLTKQICNRYLEPFMWHTALITSTEWENFISLRAPQYQTPVSQTIEPFASKKDCIANHSNPQNLELMESMSVVDWLKINKGTAEIHFMDIAEKMYDALNESEPKELKEGVWHIPFGDNFSFDEIFEYAQINYPSGDYSDMINTEHWLYQQIAIKLATVRCARISYLNQGKETPIEEDLKLHDRLAASGHWSAFEHCARAMSDDEYNHYYIAKLDYSSNQIGQGKLEYGWEGNFRGFRQYRKMFPDENRTDSRLIKK